MPRSTLTDTAKEAEPPTCPDWPLFRQTIEPLLQRLGDARIVMLGEASHCQEKELRLRNGLFQALVARLGFTAIAIESGLIESRRVHGYVGGGAGDLEDAMAGGITWRFDQCPGNRALVQWMRDHNDQGRTPAINFYGFDASGVWSSRTPYWSYADLVRDLLRFLRLVQAWRVDEICGRLEELLPVAFCVTKRAEPRDYADVGQPERDRFTATIAEAGAALRYLEVDYVRASSSEAYDWALRAAGALAQLDQWLRYIPVGWSPSSLERDLASADFFSAGSELRDREMADNIDWILAREGLGCKLLVFASRYHISKAPTHVARWGLNGRAHVRRPAGSYIRRRHGESVITIGNLVAGRDSLGTTLDTRMENGSAAPFLIDVNADAAAEWATEPQRVGGDLHSLEFRPREAFDYFIHLGRAENAA